jgi:aminoglycoside phosphotransferase (APT) family kinase protein
MGSFLRRFHQAIVDWSTRIHAAYWPTRVARGDAIAAARALKAPMIGRTPAQDVIARACEVATTEIDLPSTVGHGDCHADNFLITERGAAMFDFELVGPRAGAQATDLGVLMHRAARLAAQHAESNKCRLRAAQLAATALAAGYGAHSTMVTNAWLCAIHESLAKLTNCATTGPPGLDAIGCREIALNHCVYLAELLHLAGQAER